MLHWLLFKSSPPAGSEVYSLKAKTYRRSLLDGAVVCGRLSDAQYPKQRHPQRWFLASRLCQQAARLEPLRED